MVRKLVHLFYFDLGNFAGKYTANTRPARMHMQHYLDGLLLAETEKSLQYQYHKLHGRVVIVNKHNFIKWRALEFGFCLL